MTIFKLPAVCGQCGNIFAGGIAVGLGSRTTLSGNRSQCGICGAMAPIIDGSLQILERGIRLFSGPEFTKDVLDALGIAVEDLRLGKKPVREIVRDIETKSPSLAKEFREWIFCGAAVVSAMAAVAAAVFAYCALPSGQNRTVDEVAVDAFESVYEQPQPVIRQKSPLVKRPSLYKQSQAQTQNRKLRRAEAAKQRSKLHIKAP